MQHSADRLLSGCAVCAVVGIMLTAVKWFSSYPSFDLPPDHRMLQWTRASFALRLVHGMIGLLLATWPRLYSRISTAKREVLVAVTSVVIAMHFIFISPRYLVHLLGVGAEALEGAELQSEAHLLLKLSVVIVAVHFTVHIRWIVAVIVDATIVLLYAVALFGLCGEGSGNFFLFLVFMLLVVMISHGKWQLEYTERLFFLEVVSERRRRAEAEFQLSQKETEVPKQEETASALTSAAGRIIDNISQVEQSLEPLADIGRREQWIVSGGDLTIGSGILGAGGCGIVAPGRFLMTPVALKFSKLSTASPSLSDIGNELRVLRKLRHPNIVVMHGACIDYQQRDIVLVLERVFGQQLDAYVRQYHTETNFTFESVFGAFQILLGACRALVYLHSRQPPVVHGDLKDSNIFIETRGSGPHAKLLDFGLARVISKRVRPLGGTLRWSAPEVFTRAVPTSAADVFSYSRVIYFVFVGKKPLADYCQTSIKKAAAKQAVLPLAWPRHPSPAVEWCTPLVESSSILLPECRPSMADVCLQLERALRSVKDAVTEVSEATSSLPDLDWSGLEADKGSGPLTSSGVNCDSEVDAGFWGRIRSLRQDADRSQRRQDAPRSEPGILVASRHSEGSRNRQRAEPGLPEEPPLGQPPPAERSSPRAAPAQPGQPLPQEGSDSQSCSQGHRPRHPRSEQPPEEPEQMPSDTAGGALASEPRSDPPSRESL